VNYQWSIAYSDKITDIRNWEINSLFRAYKARVRDSNSQGNWKIYLSSSVYSANSLLSDSSLTRWLEVAADIKIWPPPSNFSNKKDPASMDRRIGEIGHR
jgi:hypothetical protein